jgi:hypothetical protein
MLSKKILIKLLSSILIGIVIISVYFFSPVSTTTAVITVLEKGYYHC